MNTKNGLSIVAVIGSFSLCDELLEFSRNVLEVMRQAA